MMNAERQGLFQTRKIVFHRVSSGYPNTEKLLKKRGAVDSFNLLRGVKIPDDTLFRMFHLASQTIDNS